MLSDFNNYIMSIINNHTGLYLTLDVYFSWLNYITIIAGSSAIITMILLGRRTLRRSNDPLLWTSKECYQALDDAINDRMFAKQSRIFRNIIFGGVGFSGLLGILWTIENGTILDQYLEGASYSVLLLVGFSTIFLQYAQSRLRTNSMKWHLQWVRDNFRNIRETRKEKIIHEAKKRISLDGEEDIGEGNTIHNSLSKDEYNRPHIAKDYFGKMYCVIFIVDNDTMKQFPQNSKPEYFLFDLDRTVKQIYAYWYSLEKRTIADNEEEKDDTETSSLMKSLEAASLEKYHANEVKWGPGSVQKKVEEILPSDGLPRIIFFVPHDEDGPGYNVYRYSDMRNFTNGDAKIVFEIDSNSGREFRKIIKDKRADDNQDEKIRKLESMYNKSAPFKA
ncbi:hypothetical protein [Aquisalimonas asiatica]|uniref:Uncharacterized protein n=1 Tax=Aquisalimonas asiatica TaxID=406100 RepID=A0A1H8VVM8_9GAMM|nr:hypothetical protein [Aquisalimonas asiatica]SEP19441.1 hypothetical protein SAMN04488052_1173 [Aquisalimonas asiatica]